MTRKPFPFRRRRAAAAILAASLAALLLIGACAGDGADSAYAPGLGEIMTLQQMRHAKLWWAGSAGNWDLAGYELDELEEGFADVVRYHPTHKDSPVPLSEEVPELTGAPLKALRAAIAGSDSPGFERAFDGLTAACNACHQATKFGFNVVRRPTVNTFANQDFAAPPRD